MPAGQHFVSADILLTFSDLFISNPEPYIQEKYTFYNDRNKIRRIWGMYRFLSPAYRFIKKCLMMLSYWLLTYVTLNFLLLSAA